MPPEFFIHNAGIINASGKDLIDFMNRMSTNDFRKFPENEFRKTVLTTDKGRIVDLIDFMNIPGQSIFITSENFQDKIISHLNKYIITDEVTLTKGSDNFVKIIILGDDLSEIGKRFINSHEAILKNRIYKIDDEVFLFADEFKIQTINIICPGEKAGKFEDLLEGLVRLSRDEFEILRIKNGIPEGPNEFNDNINPVECGLEKFISYTKGCYIGQEVIARLDSQGKKPKQMVIIESQNNISENDKIFSGDAENKESGFISSAVNVNGKNYGLGFIRSINLDFEKQYFVFGKDNEKKAINISKIN